MHACRLEVRMAFPSGDAAALSEARLGLACLCPSRLPSAWTGSAGLLFARCLAIHVNVFYILKVVSQS